MIPCKICNSDNPADQINDCLKIVELIDKEKDKTTLSLDLSDIDWLTPFSALILSAKIVQCLPHQKIDLKPPKKDEVKSYMTSIGFPLGKKVKGYSYSPIYHFNHDAGKAANEVFELIDSTFPDILKGNTVKYIISEFCDNVEQHSAFTHASIMAQYFRTKNCVDIGIIDNGKSIPAVFEENKIKFGEDPEAIDKAVHGISTKKEGGRGRGLNSTKLIVEEGLKGSFYVVSRGGMVAVEQGHGRKLYKFQNHCLSGTMGYMRFEVPRKEVDLHPYLK